MDQGRFVELLQSIQIPDTEKVKAATTELRQTYYPHSESLLWLLQILASHDVQAIRQQAAVEALRLVPKHWASLSGPKPAIRESLLKAALNEQSSLVRHSTARVISAIAGIDLEDGEWADLPGFLVEAAKQPQVGHREVGVYILFTLLEVVGDGFIDKLPILFELFSTTIRDPESPEVRINTMLALSRIAMLIDPEEDLKSLKSFQETVPSMVAVLKSTIDDNDEDRAMQAFEVFQTLLGCESALLANHFKDLVQFMIELSVEKSITDETRSQALSYLMQCVKYRRMKVQGIQGMGEQLTIKAMQIAAEMEDDDDDEDEITPARSALSLLDILASSLPPRQVIVPLLTSLPQYASSEDPAFRKAGILSLGMVVEGAPDFVATQLEQIMPFILQLLNDSDINVRQAALHGVSRLAEDLAQDMSQSHATLLPALLKNLDAASGETDKVSTGIIIGSCLALDSLVDGMEAEISSLYISELVPRIGRLFEHPDFKVKGASAGAMGSIASSAEEAFQPFFEQTMKALSQYVTMKDSEEELDLRGTVCDAMGSMATAVGAAAFQPYVQPLMAASEEALHLGHPRLRETSYILWSTMSKLYEKEFAPFLDGVVKGLLECLEQEESDLDVELGEEASDLLGTEVVVAGKKIKVVQPSAEEDSMDDDEDDDEDWDDLTAVTAIALEKEIAVEVIGDILSHTKDLYIPHLEKTVEAVMTLVDHSYEGCRKAAIGTLWRAYACLWALMEDHTGKKWTPGIPLKEQPSQELIKLGEVVATATMTVWGDEVDRAVVTDINRNIAATLKLCGPAILTQGNMLEQVTTILAALVTRQHPCQMDMGDDEDQEDIGETSEYDWLAVDTALDVVIGLSAALGSQFGEIWKVFEKPVMKLASSQEAFERSTSIGVIAECTAHMGSAVTPSTATLLKLLLHRLTDEDPESRSNAAYATGLLIQHSEDAGTYGPAYPEILRKLEPLLQTERARTLDNAAGCVSRMITAHPDKVPIGDVLPVLAGLLPLKEDYEENAPIYTCIVNMYQAGNSVVQGLTPQLVPVFAAVLGEPKEQLDEETRAKLVDTVKYIAKQQPALIQGHAVLAAL
ncbi:hypothetical protein V493_02999 [Pseudogymnoascus sp. VKM F-4281 (FW-2241)]|nr:hypothetical protein V493_02999 [Pseudogymnoascus sp. VKM F-4281 (FW-2241)]